MFCATKSKFCFSVASRAYFFFCLNLALAAFALALFCAAAVGASVTGVSSFVWEGTGLAATVPLGKGEDKGKEEEEEEYEGGAVAVRGEEEEEEEEERVGKGGWVDGRIESATNRPQKQPSHKQSSPHLHVASNPPLERRGRRVNGVKGEVGRRVR